MSESFDRAVVRLAQRDVRWTVREALALAYLIDPDDNPQTTVEVVLTDGPSPITYLAARVLRNATVYSGEGFDVLDLHDEDGEWSVAFLSTNREGVFLVAGGSSSTTQRWKRVERWLGKAHGVARCYLNHEDFARVGDILASYGAVEVSRWTARKVADMSSITRGFRAHQRSERPDHQDVIREAEQNVASIRTLALSVTGTLSIHLRRVAGCTFYSGDARIFEDSVLRVLVEAASNRRALMSGRARVPAQSVRPVSIHLERPVFKSRDETGVLISHLSAAPDISVAVFHRNPYLHVAVTDEVDGSNFDVMITEGDRIDIVPGYRASVSAMTRLGTILGERFGSKEMSDARRDRVTLDSLFA